MRFRGGKMTYLSDLNPSKVEETPFFGHRLPWRRDVNLLGEPLKMKGQTYERGVAVHSRCVLTYDLNGRYSTFEALVGFDDASQRPGPRRLPGLRRRQGDLCQPRPPGERSAGQALAAGRGGRAVAAPGGFRPRSRHGRPRDLGERPPLSSRDAQGIGVDDGPRRLQVGQALQSDSKTMPAWKA